MNVEEIRDFALSLEGVTEGFPFGNDTLVFKIEGKVFLLVSLSAVLPQFNVKCDPWEAIDMREQYSCVLPGYHMNKQHWNTVIVDGQISRTQLQSFIRNSYDLVRPRKRKST